MSQISSEDKNQALEYIRDMVSKDIYPTEVEEIIDIICGVGRVDKESLIENLAIAYRQRESARKAWSS